MQEPRRRFALRLALEMGWPNVDAMLREMTAEQFEIDLGKKLQKLREAKGKTQSEVAEELGLNSRETVKQWETWDRHIKACDLIKLSKYYGVSAD